MAIAGTWSGRFALAQNYSGARRQGTGYNPIHEVRDNPGRVTGTKENLYPLGDPSDAPPESILGPDDFVAADWDGHGIYPSEDYRYQNTLPGWNQVTPQFRDATIGNPAMGEWASWGVYNDPNAIDGFPLAGPTAGMDPYLDVHHGESTERQRALVVPTMPVAGGWKNKSHAAPQAGNDGQELAEKTAQWAVNTGQVQGPGLKDSGNDRAVMRMTDASRTPVQSRTAGIRQYSPAVSFGMGGGPGAPDMQPYQQTPGLKRPFAIRKAGLPPMEDHFMNTMEGRTPLQRTVPPDPYQGDPETTGDTSGTGAIYSEYDYSDSDVGWDY